MGWKKKPNVAQFDEGNWDNFVKKVSNTTAEEAMRIAFADPEITFFFYCRQTIILDRPPASKYGPFEQRDAVFFKGEPWYGSAPQCDSYEKLPISTVYINPKSNQQFSDISSYVLRDGTPAIDVACIFAASYCTNTIPMLRANNNDPPTNKPFNPNIQDVLSSGLVQALQSKGITVLLTIANGWSQTGWSQFTDQNTAKNFVNYLKSQVVTLYGLDGIDIDDEYSKGPVINSSLAMVTTLMKQSMPEKLITKALWSDYDHFTANWNGHTLGGNLDYGWQMSYYGGGPSSRLSFYTSYMKKHQLCLGFSAEQRFSSSWNTVGPQAKKTVSEGYGGCMMFAYENQPDSLHLMKAMVDGMDGPGNWNKTVNENLTKSQYTSSPSTLEVKQKVKTRNVRCCVII